eukprot:jgi/Psemu1/12303/gm1.12303_g
MATLKWRVNNGVEAPPRKGRPPILPPAVEEAYSYEDTNTSYFGRDVGEAQSKRNGEASQSMKHEENENGHEGELLFLPGQQHQIVNVDETGLTLDWMGSKSGGKSVMECMLVTEGTASGDPIWFRFQLKSLAEEGKRQISVVFTNQLDIARCSCVGTSWGLGSKGLKPHTTYYNPTAGMDSVKFQKYVDMRIISFYPDAQPANRKWVLLTVNSGLGRLNPKLLQLLSQKGFILLLGVPNTMHITQVTDQNFGPFKTVFYDNQRKPHASHHAEGRTVKMCSIPSLVFSYCKNWSLRLWSAFKEAPAPAASKACWRKIGMGPSTRNFLGNQNVAHQLMMLSDGSIGLDTDPVTMQLMDLEFQNDNAIATLKEHGFTGKDQIKENTTGTKYAILNGGAYKCMDQIIDVAYEKKKEAAQPLIDKCNGNFMDLPISKLSKKVFEWKLQEKSTRLNKDDIITFCKPLCMLAYYDLKHNVSHEKNSPIWVHGIWASDQFWYLHSIQMPVDP